MAKIRYTVRLYRLHDLDLITFVLTHEFDIMHAIYSAVTAFCKGEAFVIKIPPLRHQELPQLRRIYTKALVLDDKQDKAVIEMINKIKPGKRNNFFKNLLRLYLMYPFSEEFFESKDDTPYFEDKLKAFRSDQREVCAGKTRKVITRNRGEQTEELSSLGRHTSESDIAKKAVKHDRNSIGPDVNRSVESPPASDSTSQEDVAAIMEIFDGLEEG